jgi:hypothetical protein
MLDYIYRASSRETLSRDHRDDYSHVRVCIPNAFNPSGSVNRPENSLSTEVSSRDPQCDEAQKNAAESRDKETAPQKRHRMIILSEKNLSFQ